MRAVSSLQLAGEAEGAAQKGKSRVRAFGGVPTFPVVKRVLAVLGRFFARERGRLTCMRRCDFLRISAILSVKTRQRKRCAAKKRAARGPTGLSARELAKNETSARCGARSVILESL